MSIVMSKCDWVFPYEVVNINEFQCIIMHPLLSIYV
jgi:hypothetical protein